MPNSSHSLNICVTLCLKCLLRPVGGERNIRPRNWNYIKVYSFSAWETPFIIRTICTSIKTQDCIIWQRYFGFKAVFPPSEESSAFTFKKSISKNHQKRVIFLSTSIWIRHTSRFFFLASFLKRDGFLRSGDFFPPLFWKKKTQPTDTRSLELSWEQHGKGGRKEDRRRRRRKRRSCKKKENRLFLSQLLSFLERKKWPKFLFLACLVRACMVVVV